VSALDRDRLAAAKLWLTSAQGDQPYLASALYALQAVASSEVATMTVDERWRLYVHPGWLAATPVPTVAAELAHVVWHLLAEHAHRAASLDVGRGQRPTWRTATDVTIGETLAGSGLRDHGLPRAELLGLAPGRSAEEHFARLDRLQVGEGAASGAPRRSGSEGDSDAPDTCGSGADGLRRNYEVPTDELPGVADLHAAELRRQVAVEFRAHVTTRGSDPGDALRWVRHVLEPVVPWRQVLASTVRRAAGWANGQADYTYRRPSRRQSAVPGALLPAMRRPVPSVAVVVDTSASVDDGLLAQALGEVDGAIAALGVAGGDVRVLACDAAVYSVARLRRACDARLGGGGGTDLRVGVEVAAALRPRPDVLVVLTDGWTPWPEQPPTGMAVVAGMLARREQPAPPSPSWAARVECTLG
jgi:predicted metal-dependent peptidase